MTDTRLFPLPEPPVADPSTQASPQGRRRDGGEQLSLLPADGVPLQFRLDERTRRNGLRHIMEIRRQLAARHAGRHGASPRAA